MYNEPPQSSITHKLKIWNNPIVKSHTNKVHSTIHLRKPICAPNGFEAVKPSNRLTLIKAGNENQKTLWHDGSNISNNNRMVS